jgi:hypothetical protein
MSLAVWKTSLLPSVDDILLPLDKEEIMDPRRDGQIDKDVPLFRQAINLPEYGWLLDRFQFLPRMLGNWISPYYGTDILKINRDYNAIYPESAPVYDYACKVARLLLLEEIEDALLAQGKNPDTFFLQKPVKNTMSTNVLSERVMNELYRQENKALQRGGAGMVPFSSSNDTSSCQYHIDGLSNSVIFCSKFAGKSPGTWYALTPDNKVNDVRPYFLWFSGGGACATIKSLANDEQDINQIILTKVQVGTAFRDKNYFFKIDQEIQALLEKLSVSLQPVYSELTDSLDKRLDDPSLSVYNPYKEMDPNVLKDLKRLVLLVDTFNRPQNPHETAPRIEAEWIDAINYRVFATHLGPLYFTEQTRNYAVINGERQKLLKVNVLDVAAVDDLLERTKTFIGKDSIQMLNSLIVAINALPDVRVAREYVQTMQTITTDLVRNYPTVSSVNDFLDTYNKNVNALRKLQRKVNTFYKSFGKEALQLVFPDPLEPPKIDIDTIRKFKEYNNLLSLPPVNPRDFQFVQLLEAVSDKRKALIRDAALAITVEQNQTWKAFKTQYAKWIDNAGRFQNMKDVENTNKFVGEYGENLETLKARLRASGAKLRRENAAIEEKAKTFARDNLIEFLDAQSNAQKEFNEANILATFELVKNIKDIPENVSKLIFEIGEKVLSSETVLSALKPQDWGLLRDLFLGKDVAQEINELIARLDAAEYAEEQRLLQAERKRLYDEEEREKKQKVAREKKLEAAEARRAEELEQQRLLEAKRSAAEQKAIQKHEEKQAKKREALADNLFEREEQFTIESILALQVQGGIIEAPLRFTMLLGMLAESREALNVLGKKEWQFLAAILRNDDVDYYQKTVDDVVKKLATEEKRLQLLEEQGKLALSDPNIELSAGPLRDILSRYGRIEVPTGPNIITGSNFHNPNKSCPYDSLFTALFKIPGSWFENKIRMTKSVYVTYNPQHCRSSVKNRFGWTHVDELHEAILEDIWFMQSPPTAQKTLCKTRSFWKQCFETDSDLQDDPRTMLSSLFSFYKATDDLQEVLFEKDGFLSDIVYNDKQMIMFRAPDERVGQVDYSSIISLELLKGEYTLLAAFFFEKGIDGAASHWTAGIRDPRSKKWYEFDGLSPKAIELDGDLPVQVTKAHRVGKGPLGWIYVRTAWLKNVEFKNAPPKTDAYNVLIQLLKDKYTGKAVTSTIRALKPKKQTNVLMGLYKAGLISLRDYAGIIVEIIKMATSQADIDRANQMIQILESAVINALKTITE